MPNKEDNKKDGTTMPSENPSDNDAKHTRFATSFLSFLEKPAVRWFCKRFPSWVNPDMLTVIGLLGALVVGAGYLLCRYNPAFIWLASFGLLLNYFGDGLDGALARYRKIERPKYGFFIDHTVDAFAEFAVMLGVALSGYVNFTLALFALIGYFMVSVVVIAYAFVNGEFRITYGGFGPTELRALIILCNTLIFFIGKPMIELFGFRFGLYDGILVAVIAILYGIFIGLVITKGIELNRIDRKKRE